MAEATIEHLTGLVASSIHLRLGGRELLSNINITLGSREVIALIGRSGSGKTMLLRVLCGLLLPDNGNIEVDSVTYLREGRLVEAGWKLRRKVGMVFQNYNLLPNLTSRQNVTLGLQHVRKMNLRDANEEADKVARFLSISHVLHRYPSTLSGGEQQRLALARALVLHPRVLLLDEVTSALDPETTLLLINGIEKMRSAQLELFESPCSIILVTHAFNFAEKFADRILFFSNGSIIEDLPAKNFYRDAKTPEARRYLEQLNSFGKFDKSVS